jgi:plastocyanin
MKLQTQLDANATSVFKSSCVLLLFLGAFVYGYAQSDDAVHGVIRPPAPKTTMPLGEVHKIDIGNAAPFYSPAEMNISVGDVLEWNNRQLSNPHTVYEQYGDFSSPPIAPGGQWCRQFTREGDYSYSCRIHPWMHATVHVRPKSLVIRDLNLPAKFFPVGMITEGEGLWLYSRTELLQFQETPQGALRALRQIQIPSSHQIVVDNGTAWFPSKTPGQLIRVSLSTGVLAVVNAVGTGNLLPLAGESGDQIWGLNPKEKQLFLLRSTDGKVLTRFSVPWADDVGIAAAFGDGSLWMTTDSGARLMRFNVQSGTSDEFPLSKGARITALRTGESGVLWAADAGRSKLLRIEGKWTTEYTLPESSNSLASLPLDSQGYPWFSEASNRISALRPDGTFGTFAILGSAPTSISLSLQSDHSGHLWMLGVKARRLSKISLPSFAETYQSGANSPSLCSALPNGGDANDSRPSAEPANTPSRGGN